jgi:hypothetical protein
MAAELIQYIVRLLEETKPMVKTMSLSVEKKT